MRVGVVCEGPTDYYAIESFFRHALWEDNGIKAEFVPIQPEMGNINPKGGWGNVLGWLNENNPKYRIQNLFRGGVFADEHGRLPIDVLLIQLDSDILGNESFTDRVRQKYGLSVENPGDASDRADEIRNVLQCAAKFAEMNEDGINRHVIAPAVEATEAWCVAAFNGPAQNCETLRGQDLINAFMVALERSEDRVPTLPYARANKDQKRRKKFCRSYSGGSARVRERCAQFDRACQQLSDLC